MEKGAADVEPPAADSTQRAEVRAETQAPRTPRIGDKSSSARCKATILKALSPQVSVHSSQQTDQLAAHFGFHSFFQLLKPLGDDIPHKFQVKDTQLISRTIDDFSVRFVPPLGDILQLQSASGSAGGRAGPTKRAQQHELFSVASLELYLSEFISSLGSELKQSVLSGNTQHELAIKDSIYQKFFSKVLSSGLVTSFDTINHPILSLVVVRGTDDYETGKNLLVQYEKAFNSSATPQYLNLVDVVPVFMVLYDENDEAEKSSALELKDLFKKRLCVDSFVVKLTMNRDHNPVPFAPASLLSIDEELALNHIAASTGQHQLKFPAANKTSLNLAIIDIIQKKLIPFMEQKIAQWDEQVIVPKKSLTGRFFNVSKKYFNSNTSSSATEAASYNPVTNEYSKASPELVTRKLADWAFMLRDYKYAYMTYDISKKDFLAHKAWTFLASVQEMAAISLLMGATNITSKIKNDTIDPLLDSANYTYLSRCGLKTFALRSTIITSELFCTLRDGYTSTPSAIKWLSKSLDDKLLGRIGRSLILERIGYIYSICMSSQAKILLSKPVSPVQKDQDDALTNPHKLKQKNIATIGLTRDRKSAFWYLLAAKDWDPISNPLQAHCCLDLASSVYQNNIIAERDSSLYRKLVTATNI